MFELYKLLLNYFFLKRYDYNFAESKCSDFTKTAENYRNTKELCTETYNIKQFSVCFSKDKESNDLATPPTSRASPSVSLHPITSRCSVKCSFKRAPRVSPPLDFSRTPIYTLAHTTFGSARWHSPFIYHFNQRDQPRRQRQRKEVTSQEEIIQSAAPADKKTHFAVAAAAARNSISARAFSARGASFYQRAPLALFLSLLDSHSRRARYRLCESRAEKMRENKVRLREENKTGERREYNDATT